MQLQTSMSTDQEQKTLFVGCMDPKTNEDDLYRYFGLYDDAVQVKLLWNHHTNASKQCALIFCSSEERANQILAMQHRLHDRNLRVNLADKEKKGTKMAQLYYLQVSGIPLNTPLEEVEKAFTTFPEYHSSRYIHGIHQKQKWVAKVSFKDQGAFRNLLATQSHVLIAQKLCKIAEFQPKGSSTAYSEAYSTRSSQEELEQGKARINRLEKISLSHDQFCAPYSTPNIFERPQPQEFSWNSSARSMQSLFRSSPDESQKYPAIQPSTKLYSSTPYGPGTLKSEGARRAYPSAQIFMPEFEVEEDDQLLSLFCSRSGPKNVV